MRQIVYMAAFWIVLIVAIRLAVCFPRSLLARALFSEYGPRRSPGEPDARYCLRAAAYRAGWVLQCVCVFGAGALALRSHPEIADSLTFMVFWAAVVPFLAACACIGALVALARAAWHGADMKWRKRSFPAT